MVWAVFLIKIQESQRNGMVWVVCCYQSPETQGNKMVQVVLVYQSQYHCIITIFILYVIVI